MATPIVQARLVERSPLASNNMGDAAMKSTAAAMRAVDPQRLRCLQRRKRRVVLFGAIGRHNFGDLLMGHVAEALLVHRCGYRVEQLLHADVLAGDMRSYGGHNVVGVASLAREHDHALDVIHVGGETLGCRLRDAVDMFPSRADGEPEVIQSIMRLAEVSPLLGPPDSPAYVLPREFLQRAGSYVLNAVSAASILPEALERIRTFDFISSRDPLTDQQLQSAMPEKLPRLAPDSVVTVRLLFSDRVQAQAMRPSLRDLRTAHMRYMTVQLNTPELLAAGGPPVVAAHIGAVALKHSLPVVFYVAGAAQGHDSMAQYHEIGEHLSKQSPSVRVIFFEDLDIWAIVALIAGATLSVASSLHSRIVALAFSVPRVTWTWRAKVWQFAHAWEPGVAAATCETPDHPLLAAVDWSLDPARGLPQLRNRSHADSVAQLYLSCFDEWSSLLGEPTPTEDVVTPLEVGSSTQGPSQLVRHERRFEGVIASHSHQRPDVGVSSGSEAVSTMLSTKEQPACRCQHEVRICMRGLTQTASRSLAFWHFWQGMLIDALLRLHEHGLFGCAKLRLHFALDGAVPGELRRVLAARARAWFPVWLPSQSAPSFGTDCSAECAESCNTSLTAHHQECHHQELAPGFPAFQLGEIDEYYARCKAVASVVDWMHSMHSSEETRLGPVMPRVWRTPRLVYIQREPPRCVTNDKTFSQALKAVCEAHGVQFVAARLETMPAEEQARLVLSTDVLVGFHGSGIGSLNFLLGRDSVVIEVMPSNTWHCSASLCAAKPPRQLSWLQLVRDPERAIPAAAPYEFSGPKFSASNWVERRDVGRDVDTTALTELLQRCFGAWVAHSTPYSATVQEMRAERLWRTSCNSTTIELPS